MQNNSYVPIKSVATNNRIEVVDQVYLYEKTFNATTVTSNSDFVIKSNKNLQTPPLVLPCQQDGLDNTANLTYTNAPWEDDDYKNVPFESNTAINDRKLPGQNIPYPFLTAGDFFQATLCKTGYPFDNDNFHLFTDLEQGFLLPLKQTFFDYFDVKNLSTLVNGQKMLEFRQSQVDPNTIDVILRIPVQQNQHITYTKSYSQNPTGNKPAKGKVVDYSFGMAIFPNYKLSKNNQYRIAFYNDSNNANANLTFLKASDNSIVEISQASKNNAANNDLDSNYFKIEDAFEYMLVQDGNGNCGLLIPKFKDGNTGQDAFEFAIDFGTTNTHIEYRREQERPKAFDIQKKDIQLKSDCDKTKFYEFL